MVSFLAGQVREMARSRARFAALVLALLLEGLYHLGSPVLYKFIFDEGIGQGQQSVLFAALGGLGVLLLFQTVATFMQERLGGALGVAAMNRLRGRLFAKLQSLPPHLAAARPQGELVQLFGADVTAVEQAQVRAVPSLLLYGAVIAVSLVLLLVINWMLFLVTLAAMPAVVFVPKLFAAAADRWECDHQRAKAAVTGFTQESIATLPVIRLFHLRRAREQAFAGHLGRMAEAAPRAYLFGGLVARTAFLGTGLAQLIVIGVGSVLAVTGGMTAGLLVAFVGLLMGIGEAVSMLTTAIPLLITARQAQARIAAFLAEPVPMVEVPGARPVGRLSGAIAFEDVHFSYDGVTPALSGLSLRVLPGQRVALVGPSGCGKSTALSLLMRFAAVQSGRIVLDGHPIDAITEESLRANVAVVPQSAILFDATIRANILAGRPDAGEDEVIDAARAAGIHDAIMARPDGYDTRIGAGAGALSGGERQRIAVARALLRRAPILLLDEATSALDPASELVVNETVAGLAGRCTVVSVTHRLAAVTDYDQILVLQQGRLVEAGTHAGLLAQPGLYASLWSKQQGMAASDESAQVITPERLALIPFLSECRRQTLEDLCQLFVMSHFAEGKYVFRQGDHGERFYLIARGCFEVRVQDGDGGERVVAVLRDGDFFGELALLRDVPRAASVAAWAESWCLSLSRQHFLRIIQAEPGLRARVAAGVDAIKENGGAAWPGVTVDGDLTESS